ncbi:MAG TPA: helix-turn-helix domain-containing protein [Candidatus Limnocylindrales bacterium]|nr:helix-turn-helix domain-containing protein [Candidatus Limnocylindrales bacterium]
MTDLATLASELLPGTQLRGGAPTNLRPISWVRVMRDRIPAFDVLDAGDLVIMPASALSVVAPGAAALEDLASSLAAVPVSGALLLDGAADAADALGRAGVPVVVVPRTDAAALERSVVGYIVARGAELERQAALLEAELRRRALDGAGAAGLLATVAGFLGRALALEGPRGDAIAVHVPAHVPGAAADAAAYQVGSRHSRRAPSDSNGVVLRVPMPAAHGVAGAILVLGAAPPSELAVVMLPRVAELLALELAREEAIRGAADRARHVEAMPSAGPPWVVAVARQREPDGHVDEPAAREAREQLRRAVRLLAPARRMSLRGDADSIEVRAVLAVDPAGGPDPDGRIAAAALAGVVGRVVALSRPFHSPNERPAAEAEARATLEAAERLPGLPGPGKVALGARLAAYRMLGALHQLADGPRLAHAVLEPLLASRVDVRREHLATLAAYLDGGGVGEAATTLAIHRNTVTYRMRRIEALTGWDLTDPDLRLALQLALRLVQDH